MTYLQRYTFGIAKEFRIQESGFWSQESAGQPGAALARAMP